MTSNSKLTTYKFLFSAKISKFSMNAKVTSPIFITWKRSQETAKSGMYDMTDGNVDFSTKGQILKLPVNMYFDHDSESFQEKKSIFNFTMNTPKGEKVAGVVYVDLSKLLNNKLTEIEDTFILEKCPVKNSTVHMNITSECLGQKSGDTMSQVSSMEQNQSLSMISIQSKVDTSIDQSHKQQSKSTSDKDSKKTDEVQQLNQKIALLTKINKRLQTELAQARKVTDGDTLKQQLIKSKTIQNKLEEEVNQLRKENMEHEIELQKVRNKLEGAYENIYSSLSQHFL